MNTPWTLKRRPAGDWTIDRLTAGRIERHGPFPFRRDADKCAELLRASGEIVRVAR